MAIAALVGHASGSSPACTSTRSTPHHLIIAADTIAGYIEGLQDDEELKQTAYTLDRDARKAALARFLLGAAGEEEAPSVEHERLAA